MFSQETSEEVAAELSVTVVSTLNKLAQKMLAVKDKQIDKFHGRDNEDVLCDEMIPNWVKK